MRKEAWFGISILIAIVAALVIFMPAPADITNGHLGLLMLALIVVTIMLGFPTAFTLMGMGVIFTLFAYRAMGPKLAIEQTLDLMVLRTYAVMTNDVLIAVPLFIFMGYLVERANLIEKLFKSLHLVMAKIPGSLAVATVITCAVFATATGIVGAVVTLMGLLALPAMLKAGYDVKLSAGVITAGGCLGILIPPSVLLIVYGAVAGVSVVKLYAAAFFPGLMLAGMYVVYIIVVAKIKPAWAPPLSEEERRIPLPEFAASIKNSISNKALPGLLRALKGERNIAIPASVILKQLFIVLIPAIMFACAIGLSYKLSLPTTQQASTLTEMGSLNAPSTVQYAGSLQEPAGSGLAEPPGSLAEPPGATLAEPPGTVAQPPGATPPQSEQNAASASTTPEADAPGVSPTFWIVFAAGLALMIAFYAWFTFARLEIFKMLMASFFPLAIMILAVLGSIVFGFATPSEAAAMGAFGGILLALCYRRLNMPMLKESVYLAARTSAMVCWLFVGSSIFSAAFALLGGQEIINTWVVSMDLTPLEFMILAQIVIFLLGWPLEWTEIIVIFMPIFLPLLAHYNIDPLFFGILVAMNLQTAFLSPPVAMSAFYLKGVAPPHVTLNQIFLGMLPFMGIQILALILLYVFPKIGLWLPEVLY
ncbi:tripartite ATP-independent transporter DctM subunit [Advenella incenata]|jgi:TRAP-type mannitol/chloroaromatic compound transport system permease large subunit|uniref:Tripartite ATP-independent transporter DctM subunit n=1 Tax=Advenella incenata TaxID=267800 RepID=A0A4Q7V7I2_9BURK|nr:TRAP transporter large permease subunit [Advenella incenata]RZT91547.1 tripartite ATP-independent transporter DctM subunit [Advenella incenata]